LVEALRHKMGGSVLDFRWGLWKFWSDLFLLSAFSSREAHSSSNRNYYKGLFLRIKCGWDVELKTLSS